MATDLPPLSWLVAECPERKVKGFVVVDTMVGVNRGSADGTSYALGGTRITPGVTLDEVKRLARKMTLKLALAELPIGGAKAGIVCGLPPGKERDETLRTFGRLVAPLMKGGVYLGGGIPSRDIPRYIRLFKKGKLPVDALMSDHIRLDEINEAFDKLARSGAGSFLVRPSDNSPGDYSIFFHYFF